MFEALIQITGTSLMFLTPLVIAYRYGKNQSKGIGLSNEEVAKINKSLENEYPISLQIEEINYIFKRDFNQSILQFRSDITDTYEQSSREIASL